MEYKQLSDDQKIKFIQCLNRINDNVTAKIENTNENKKKEM